MSSSYYNHETHNIEWDDDADLDDRYYPDHARRHATFEEMLNCNWCWLEEAKARKEALAGVLDSEVGSPVSGPE
jgi:hypothetical protein